MCNKALAGAEDSHDHSMHGHEAVWHGLVMLGGIYLFFLVERLVGFFTERKHTQNEYRLKVALVCHLYFILLVCL